MEVAIAGIVPTGVGGSGNGIRERYTTLISLKIILEKIKIPGPYQFNINPFLEKPVLFNN